MSAGLAMEKTSLSKSDGTDRFFYWAIAIVFVCGFSANLYRSYTAEAPSLETFLDLLTAHKNLYCNADGEIMSPSWPINTPNCLDYNGYRIVQGPTTIIFEIQNEKGHPRDGHRLVKVAELDAVAMKRLFNLRNVDVTYTIPEYPWP
jgi:hypothetical protein